jgi:hypothetical protein
MPKRRGRSYWSQIVDECERRTAGETQEAFAARKKVNVDTLRSWIYQLRRERDAAQVEQVRFQRKNTIAWCKSTSSIRVTWVRGVFRLLSLRSQSRWSNSAQTTSVGLKPLPTSVSCGGRPEE